MLRKFSIILFTSVITFIKCIADNCISNPTGNYYSVSSTADSGPGSLRQIILDANADQTGGYININVGQPITLFSPLPPITTDSLTIYGLNVDFNHSVTEPLFTFSNSSSCVTSNAYIINVNPVTFTVTNTNDTGTGSLREALILSNASASADQIYFDIPGAAPHTISTLSPLPDISNPVTINGSTQPANGYTGYAPKIDLDGSLAPALINGFSFSRQTYMPAQNVTIYGLSIHDYGVGITISHMLPTIGGTNFGNIINNCSTGLFIEKSNGVYIRNNYFGVDSSSLIANPNLNGISLIYDTNTTISNNVISGNTTGIQIAGGLNHNVTGNKIGTDSSGMVGIANTTNGISLGSNTTGITISGNLISGNRNATGTCRGIDIGPGPDVQVSGNKIGTNITGNDTLGNDYGIYDFAHRIDIDNNLISGNTTGIFFNSTGSITNNKIGTDLTGYFPLSNNKGIFLGFNQVDTVEISNNLISGNETGIFGQFAEGYCIIKKNYIGLDNSHMNALPNEYGISYTNGPQGRVMIGGNNPSDGNYVSGNLYSGIGLGCLCTPTSTIVRNNKVGINVSNGAVGNYKGITILSTGNIVSDNIVKNNFVGIHSYSSDSNAEITGNTIENNTTGIIADGANSSITNNFISNNDLNGIEVTGDFNTISENSIFDNGLKGIELDSFSTGNNYISPPVILVANTDSVFGTSLPNSTIELFYNHSINQYQQGKAFISAVMANNAGSWKYVGPLNQPCNVTATQTDSAGNTSEFAVSIIPASAGPDSLICTGIPLMLYASDLPIGLYGAWSSQNSLLFTDSTQEDTYATGFNTPGFYTLVWSVTNFFCTNHDTLRIEAQVCTGLSEVVLNNVTIYPNPSSDKFHIDVPEKLINSTFFLYDLSGKIIFTKRIETRNSIIDKSELSEGVYFFNLINDLENYSGKIFVK